MQITEKTKYLFVFQAADSLFEVSSLIFIYFKFYRILYE